MLDQCVHFYYLNIMFKQHDTEPNCAKVVNERLFNSSGDDTFFFEKGETLLTNCLPINFLFVLCQ